MLGIVVFFLVYLRNLSLFHLPVILMFSGSLPCRDSIVVHEVQIECVPTFEALIQRLASPSLKIAPWIFVRIVEALIKRGSSLTKIVLIGVSFVAPL